MMKILNGSFFLLVLFFVTAYYCPVFSIDFDELDLPPAGAHKGQMLLGVSTSVGAITGDIADAEDAFLDDTTYTFDNETTKLLEVFHLAFSLGISFEYMPFDYFGLKTKLKRTFIVQRSSFGSEYQNWRGVLYDDYSMMFGISFHATNRKQWDFTLTPMLGYSLYELHATPVAGEVVDGYSGDMKRSGKGIVYGAELNCTLYFSGGLYMTFGGEWMRNPVSFSESYDLTNPQTGAHYMNGASGGSIDSYSFIFSAGYAFSN